MTWSDPARRTARSLAWTAAILLVVDAATLVGLEVATTPPARAVAAPGAGSGSAAAARARPPLDDGWYVCQLEHGGRPVVPVAAAVTYLDAWKDVGLTATELRAWFGDLDPSVIDVWRLETTKGERRIAFEVSRARWSRWDQVIAGLSGRDVCSAVRAELVARGVGRPRAANADPSTDDKLARSRHDFEMIYARRPTLYNRIEWVGTLDLLRSDLELAMLQLWLETGR